MPITKILIEPAAFYCINDAALMLGLSRDRLDVERRAGRLLVSRKGRRSFIKGEWLLEWLENTREGET